MHTCPPPKKTLQDWLEDYPDADGSFGHLLLEEKDEKNEELYEELRPYFESAHFDARQHFHKILSIDLHPDANGPAAHAKYPNCLPRTTQHGLFGEAMIGLVTEGYPFIGNHNWTIPVFLFRYHLDVDHYLFALLQNPDKKRQIFGRPGSDFVALCLDDEGGIVRFISGEAKWRKSMTPGMANTLLLGKKIDDPDGGEEKVRSGKGIWNELNQDTHVPHGLSQLQRLLKEPAPDDYAETILSLDRILSLQEGEDIPRTDLVLLAGNGGRTREPKSVLIDFQTPPEEYTAGNNLQVVELILQNGEELIDRLYSSLWDKGVNDAET